LTAYTASRKEAADVALDGNAVASCILALVCVSLFVVLLALKILVNMTITGAFLVVSF
jgi:hypothetical protein